MPPIGPAELSNIRQVALFMLPPDPELVRGAGSREQLLLSLGLVVTTQNSAALAELLGTAAKQIAIISGAAAPGQEVREDAGDGLTRYLLAREGGTGIHLNIAEAGELLVLSLSEEVARAGQDAARSGESALSTGVMAAGVADLEPGACKLAILNAAAYARLFGDVAMAAPHAPPEASRLMDNLAEALADTSVRLHTVETDEGLSLRLGIEGLPEIAALFGALVSIRSMRAVAEPPSAPAAVGAIAAIPTAVEIPRASMPITLDGGLSDWAEVSPLPEPRVYRQVHGHVLNRVWLAWTEEGLYAAADIQTAEVTTDPEEPWNADSLELFLEPHANRSQGQSHFSAQIAFAPDATAGPTACVARVIWGGPHFREAANDLQCAWDRTDRGYAIEAFIPAAALRPMPMSAGMRMGFNYAINDGGGWVQQFHSNKMQDHGYWRPATWGLVELAD
jgi:hypothetical protein